MRTLAQLAVFIGGISLVTAVVLFVRAIWTVGPDSGRYGGTAAVFLLIGFVFTSAGACWLDLNPRGLR